MTELDEAWGALAVDIHSNGYSVRDAIAAHRPTIEAEASLAAAFQAIAELRGIIGTTDEDNGLEHWHYARSGRSPEERAGVFVDRGQVLSAIDRILNKE
mgnify:CR=1 FL=1